MSGTDPKARAMAEIDAIIRELIVFRMQLRVTTPGDAAAGELVAAGMSGNYDARLRGIAVMMMLGGGSGD